MGNPSLKKEPELTMSLPMPWNRLTRLMTKYFMLDGRYTIIFGPNIIILFHFIWGEELCICFPFSLAKLIRDSISQLKNREEIQLRHLGLITFIYRKYLMENPRKRININ